MNKSQKVMFKEFGNNILAVDGTHGLNGYDFELTTLMVIDEFGNKDFLSLSCFPTGRILFCISYFSKQ
jgi:hypothetical protein